VSVRVADTVGAGDAFTGGLLAALARRDLLTPTALSWLRDEAVIAAMLDEANLVPAITCTRSGADPPSSADVAAAAAGSAEPG